MSVSLRGMKQADIPTCQRLSNQVGWNQTAADWARLIAWEPLGCFVAEQAGEVVATVTTTYESRLAWVGMMLVDTTLRRQGIGRISVARLLRCARNDRPNRPCGESRDEAITHSYSGTHHKGIRTGRLRFSGEFPSRLSTANLPFAASLDPCNLNAAGRESIVIVKADRS